MSKKSNDLLQIIIIYLIIAVVGLGLWYIWPYENQVIRLLVSDLGMTLVCFFFSVVKKNSSVYDAYWSIIPFYFVLFWSMLYLEKLDLHRILSMLVISIWSWRLTLNWVRSWSGFHHEDWRYIKLAKENGKLYPLVNFFGIHLFPTLLVFAGMWPIYYIFQNQLFSSGIFFLGIAVSLIGTGLEYVADNQLAAFRKTNPPSTQLLDTGIWSRSRHPNYLGEMLFWLGLFVIGYAYQAPYYTVIGALSMMALFIFISIPMKEARMSARKSGFEAYSQKVPMVILKIF